MAFVKISDRPDLIKDTETGAILNVNRGGADEYFAKKSQINRMKEVQQEVQDIKDKLSELEDIKENMSEIKSLLKEILNK